MTSHQISIEDFQGFTGATIISSTGTKRLWMVARPIAKNVYFVVCDRGRGDTLEVQSGSSIVYNFDEAIDLYNSIR
jgi:hypothetical protein